MSESGILIVEDDAELAADLSGKLANLGYAVTGVATHGREAIEMVARQRPGLVLMDLGLEGRDGHPTVRIIKDRYDLPVIYLTAHSDAATLARAKRTGPVGLILKPFEGRELAAQIELALHRHRGDQKLRKSEERYRSLFANTQAVMLLIDPRQGRIIDANPAACAYYGYAPEEIVRRTIEEITLQSARQIGAVFATDQQLQHCHQFQKHRLADGRIRDVEIFCGPMRIDRRDLMFAIVHDITERQQAQEALQRSRDTLGAVIENLDVGVMIVDAQGRLHSMNTAALAMHEFASHNEIYPSAEQFMEAFELRRMNGRVLAPEEWPMPRSLAGDYFKDLEIEVYNRKTGRKWVWSWSVSPVYDRYGDVDLLVLSVRDITERKTAEDAVKRSHQELEQFSYAASHDLQEPLRSIIGFLQLLQSRYDGQIDDRGRHYIERAVAAGRRMQTLIGDLLALSRASTSSGKFATTNLNDLVRAVMADLESALQSSPADVACAELPTLFVDPSQIQRLFQNLLVNGIKYNHSANPRIEIGCTLEDNGYRFSVTDNGIGIAPQFHERIFKAFQRLHTDREYPGTGVGLALCRRIVERHGGAIWVASEAGEGSTFYFTLPDSRRLAP